MLAIKDAQYLGDYRLSLTFSNGRTGVADLEEYLRKETRNVFQYLKNKEVFSDFTVKNNTLVWLDELDMAPEFLFYMSFKDDDSFRGLFEAWGYVK